MSRHDASAEMFGSDSCHVTMVFFTLHLLAMVHLHRLGNLFTAVEQHVVPSQLCVRVDSI